MIISPQDLSGFLKNSETLVVDTRAFGEYSNGHIPGAVNLDLFAFHWNDTSNEGLRSFENQCKQLFSFIGITPSKKVIFYDNVSGMLASRGVWLLNLFSHKEVFLLDGGFNQWKNLGLEIERKTIPNSPSKFDGILDYSLLASYDYIEKNLEKIKLIDARSKEEYDGSTVRAARGGHIPTSSNIDWNLNLTNDGKLKSIPELKSLYEFDMESEIVTYCQGAYRAANTFIVLKLLGYSKVRVYLGSWGEWGNKLELPVS